MAVDTVSEENWRKMKLKQPGKHTRERENSRQSRLQENVHCDPLQVQKGDTVSEENWRKMKLKEPGKHTRERERETERERQRERDRERQRQRQRDRIPGT